MAIGLSNEKKFGGVVVVVWLKTKRITHYYFGGVCFCVWVCASERLREVGLSFDGLCGAWGAGSEMYLAASALPERGVGIFFGDFPPLAEPFADATNATPFQ